jgi:YD repeat-containing protein
LFFPFTTLNPGSNGAASGFARDVEDNTLSSPNPSSPYYIDTNRLADTDAVHDGNVFLTYDPNWLCWLHNLRSAKGKKETEINRLRFQEMDSFANFTNFEYDNAGRRTKVTVAIAHQTQFTYDESTRRIRFTTLFAFHSCCLNH